VEQQSKQEPSSGTQQQDVATFLAKLSAEIVASPLFYLVAGQSKSRQTRLQSSFLCRMATCGAAASRLHCLPCTCSSQTECNFPAKFAMLPPADGVPAAASAMSCEQGAIDHRGLAPAAGLIAIKLVASTGESAASIFIFAALPITALTALSKSSLGKQVQQQLEGRLPQLQAEAEQVRQQHAAARDRSGW
jgi:hypothetical protein